jgi:hypothetical protein
MRASARYTAALHMPPYTQRRRARQLCDLMLALALLSIQCTGISATRRPSLTPLRTSLVPFDISIQSPNPMVAQLSIAASSVKRIALPFNANALPMPPHVDFASQHALDPSSHFGAAIPLSGRAPPTA